MTEQFVPLLILGLFAGVMSGMFGIGGGLIIVPALTILLSFDLNTATGTSLVALLMPVAIFAALAYYRAGKLDIRTAILVAVGLASGSYFGARIALSLDVDTLQRLYGIFVLTMSWRFMEPRKVVANYRVRRANGGAASPSVDETLIRNTVSPSVVLLVGLGAGILAGMFGIGGGIVIVPALILILNFDQKEATGTSLAALIPPVALPAVIEYYNAGKLDFLIALPVAVGLLFGGLMGARLALNLPTLTVKRAYGVFLLFVGLRFLLGDLLYQIFNRPV